MARGVYSTVAIITIFTSLLFGIVLAYYCEWNLCGPDEYCCGENYCCNSVYSLWYLWAGIVILAIMLWSCGGGLLRYCFAIRSQIDIKPVRTILNPHSRVEIPSLGSTDVVETQTVHSLDWSTSF